MRQNLRRFCYTYQGRKLEGNLAEANAEGTSRSCGGGSGKILNFKIWTAKYAISRHLEMTKGGRAHLNPLMGGAFEEGVFPLPGSETFKTIWSILTKTLHKAIIFVFSLPSDKYIGQV